MFRNLLSITAAILLLAACRQQENVGQIKAINECLLHSNAIIEYDNRLTYEAMVAKVKNLETEQDAIMWEPRTVMVIKRADSITHLIENLKSELLKQSDSLRRASTSVAKQLHEKNGDGYVLVNKLAAFKESIPGIFRGTDFTGDQSGYIMRDLDHILDSIPLLQGWGDSLTEAQRNIYEKKWVEDNFTGGTSLLTMMQLNKIKNEVLVTEKCLIDYFIAKTNVLHCFRHKRLYPLAVLSSNSVKSGQSIEVTAGVAQFISAPAPRITINGKEIGLNTSLESDYTLIASGKPGKHAIPVTIDYYESDGSQVRVMKNLTYTITTEK